MGKINNLQSLELEMEKAKLRLRSIEDRLDKNMSELKQNAGSMAFNSIIGEDRKQKLNSFWSKLTEKLLDNPRLQNNVGKWVDKIADRLADTIDPDKKGSESES